MQRTQLSGAEGGSANRPGTVKQSGGSAEPNHVKSNLLALDAYRRELGRSKATIWRYRQKGWLTTVNVLGRLYVSREAVAAFERLINSGDLAKDPHGCAAKAA
jgi:hypothetical protein